MNHLRLVQRELDRHFHAIGPFNPRNHGKLGEVAYGARIWNKGRSGIWGTTGLWHLPEGRESEPVACFQWHRWTDDLGTREYSVLRFKHDQTGIEGSRNELAIIRAKNVMCRRARKILSNPERKCMLP
jgi:hypothetical protein